VEEFVSKYVENIGVRPSKANTLWVHKKLAIDINTDVRVRLRKVGYRRDEIHLPLHPSALRNMKSRPAFETAHYTGCAKVEALNELCSKHAVHHKSLAQRGSPVLPSRASNDWKPLLFEPIEQRRYQPKLSLRSKEPTSDCLEAAEGTAGDCPKALRCDSVSTQGKATQTWPLVRERSSTGSMRAVGWLKQS
jgi:hypothetical protein